MQGLHQGGQQLSLQVGGRDHHQDEGMSGLQEEEQDRLLTEGLWLSLLQGGVQHRQQGEQLHQPAEQAEGVGAEAGWQGPDQELAGEPQDRLRRRRGGPGHTDRDQGDHLTELEGAEGDQDPREESRADHLLLRRRAPAR